MNDYKNKEIKIYVQIVMMELALATMNFVLLMLDKHWVKQGGVIAYTIGKLLLKGKETKEHLNHYSLLALLKC